MGKLHGEHAGWLLQGTVGGASSNLHFVPIGWCLVALVKSHGKAGQGKA